MFEVILAFSTIIMVFYILFIIFIRFIMIIQKNKEIVMNHELMHGYISNQFGFRKWKIQIHFKEKDAICITTIPKEVLIPRNIAKIFLWNLTQSIFDLSIPCLCLDFINIIKSLRNFLSINKEMIIKTIEFKE